jgi:hypothetical protein
MSSPQERQMRDERQKIKRRMLPGLQRSKNTHQQKETYKKIGWTTMKVHRIYNNNNNNRHKEVYMPINYKRRGWKHSFF